MVEDKLKIIQDACENKKGVDIKVLDIKRMSSIADYFVIVSGNSSTQVGALADDIEDKMEAAGYHATNLEGKNSLRWILLDFDDIIVHVFHKDEREYYNIERLWTDDSVHETKED
ncbi:ribosome silencing factor [Peptoniphilus equinus]|uniref:Ribosomal silencing factor RsfS n=1 Tax=Peptoniphilus equinus TaxID=3016343 RepID=A0ABY7QR16_9FIRM|nr:ribosome silencing factor [Peptoniphilus equinus]WBW49209.1 ribosome silencing factor [Peptoniphilus equinus]